MDPIQEFLTNYFLKNQSPVSLQDSVGTTPEGVSYGPIRGSVTPEQVFDPALAFTTPGGGSIMLPREPPDTLANSLAPPVAPGGIEEAVETIRKEKTKEALVGPPRPLPQASKPDLATEPPSTEPGPFIGQTPTRDPFDKNAALGIQPSPPGLADVSPLTQAEILGYEPDGESPDPGRGLGAPPPPDTEEKPESLAALQFDIGIPPDVLKALQEQAGEEGMSVAEAIALGGLAGVNPELASQMIQLKSQKQDSARRTLAQLAQQASLAQRESLRQQSIYDRMIGQEQARHERAVLSQRKDYQRELVRLHNDLKLAGAEIGPMPKIDDLTDDERWHAYLDEANAILGDEPRKLAIRSKIPAAQEYVMAKAKAGMYPRGAGQTEMRNDYAARLGVGLDEIDEFVPPYSEGMLIASGINSQILRQKLEKARDDTRRSNALVDQIKTYTAKAQQDIDYRGVDTQLRFYRTGLDAVRNLHTQIGIMERLKADYLGDTEAIEAYNDGIKKLEQMVNELTPNLEKTREKIEARVGVLSLYSAQAREKAKKDLVAKSADTEFLEDLTSQGIDPMLIANPDMLIHLEYEKAKADPTYNSPVLSAFHKAQRDYLNEVNSNLPEGEKIANINTAIADSPLLLQYAAELEALDAEQMQWALQQSQQGY